VIPISYNLRSLKARKATTIATALGIGLVVFVIAATAMLVAGLEQTLSATGDPSNAIVLRKGSDGELSSSIDEETAKQIAGKAGAAKTVGELVVVVTLDKAGEPGKISNVTVRGVTPDSIDLRKLKIEGERPKSGSEVIVGRRIIGRFSGLELGKTFELKKNFPVKVVGVFDAGGSSYESEVWADVDAVRSSFGRDKLFSSVTVRLQSPAQYDAFETAGEQGKEFKDAALNVMREPDYYEKQSEGMSLFIMMIGYFCAFFFALGAMIGATITMYGSVAQRRREIGTLRALGFGRGSVLFSFLLEALCLSLIGGLVGVAASLAMGYVKFSMVNFATWSEIVFTFHATPKIVIVALILGAVMGLLGGLAPAIRAARTSPLHAMRA